MTPTHGSRRRRLIAAATIAAIGVTLLAAVAIAARPGDSREAPRATSIACKDADRPARDLNKRKLRKAIRCLANEHRAVRGLAALRPVNSLRKASQRHARAMVRTNCLAHQCPREDDLETRLRKAGYFKPARRWRFAENTGCGLTPEAMVANWMESTFHRVNIVEPRFREVGVGVVKERVKKRCKPRYATFAAVFAWRLKRG